MNAVADSLTTPLPQAGQAFLANAFARVLRRGWWIAPPVLGLALASAAFFTSRQQPVYRATTMLVVAPNTQVEGIAEVMRGLETLERRTVLATFARIPMTAEMRIAVAERLGLTGPEAAGLDITASVVPNTNILRIDVDGPDPVRVAGAANAAGAVTRDEARSLYRIFTMRVLAQARPPARPVHPDPRRNLTVAAILGVFAAGLAVFVVDRLRRPLPAS